MDPCLKRNNQANLLMSYPNTPGFVADSQSSREAADSMRIEAASLRSKIYMHVVKFPEGKTCDEIEVDLGLTHQTASARCTELKATKHLIPLVEGGKKVRRATRSGRKADVLVPGGRS